MTTTSPACIERLCQGLWELEAEHALLDWSIDDIKPWQACRMRIYYLLAEKLNLLTDGKAQQPVKPSPKPIQSSWLERNRQNFASHITSIRYSPAFLTPVDAVVMESGRVFTDGQIAKDTYTYFLLEELQQKGHRTLLLQNVTNSTWQRLQGPVFPLYDLHEIQQRDKKVKKKKAYTFSKVECNRLEEINALLQQQFGIQIDLKPIFASILRQFKLQYPFYTKLLSKTKPKNLYVVCHYGKAPLIKAAKDLKIPITEIQHGTMSQYHLGYSYPNQPAGSLLEYFPDRFLSWGPYWMDLVPLPLSRDRIEYVGFPYFRQQKKHYQTIEKQANLVLVASQTLLSTRLAQHVYEAAKKNPDLKFIYKLHPREYTLAETNPAIQALSELHNVSIMSDGDLYEFMAQARYIVGVFSTAIYEAIAFGCKPILFNLPGIEYMDSLIQKYNIPVVTSGEDFQQATQEAQLCQINEQDFF